MKRNASIIYGLIRPPFAVLLGLCVAVGMAQTGHPPTVAHQVVALVAVAGWMLFAVAVNDLADQRIDCVNLSNDPRRVLVTGHATRSQVTVIAILAGLAAIGAATTLGGASIVVVSCGLALAAAYSLPPLRLSARGALTSALLPVGYVTVPYLIGAFSAGAGISELSPRLLIGLYLGFMGRLVLKDFRDEHGDRLYGKRTMLVRHGRTRTCVFAAVFWTAGATSALGAFTGRPATFAALTAYEVVVLVMLADITSDRHGVRDVANIAAIATVGRALIYTVLIQLATTINGWTTTSQSLIVGLTTIASLGMAWECRRELLPVTGPLTDRDRQVFRVPRALPDSVFVARVREARSLSRERPLINA